MIRINLLPNWRKLQRQMVMARELCHYSFMLLCMTVALSAYVVISTISW